MFIIANLVLIVMAGFIAYWLANQGLFSALLHLVCVVVAGAIAFAVWEPLVTGFLLRGGGFDNYAWGIVLVGVFVVTLFILRLVMDRIAPANVGMPHWADLIFGGGVGAAAGVLTVGIFIIGAGHVQSSNKLLGGFRGWARDGNRGGQIVQRDKLWIPFHTLTAEFYGWLSVTSLSTSTPLRHYNPYPDRQATLLRDAYGSGRGQLSLGPGSAKIAALFLAPPTGGRNTYFVRVRFDLGAHDFGEQLTMSSAQIRLIGRATGTSHAPVAHPVAWRQHSGYHRFDDTSHFLSSEPGKESTDAMLEFDVPAGFEPRFIQIRGTRFSLPRQVQEATPEGLAMISRGGGTIQASVGGASIQQQIKVSNSIRPVNVSTNVLPSGINEQDKLLTTGEATFKPGRSTGSRALKIQGIFEPAGTRCVRVDVSRNGPADIFRFRTEAGDDATIALVDVAGNNYSPIGYIYKHSEGTTIKLVPARRIRTIDDLPTPPTSGSQQLDLLFYVTEGVTIIGLRFGDIDVGTCSLAVPTSSS